MPNPASLAAVEILKYLKDRNVIINLMDKEEHAQMLDDFCSIIEGAFWGENENS